MVSLNVSYKLDSVIFLNCKFSRRDRTGEEGKTGGARGCIKRSHIKLAHSSCRVPVRLHSFYFPLIPYFIHFVPL